MKKNKWHNIKNKKKNNSIPLETILKNYNKCLNLVEKNIEITMQNFLLETFKSLLLQVQVENFEKDIK